MSHLSITSIYLMEKYVFLMILLEKNIFLKICHTIASGTDLRKTPHIIVLIPSPTWNQSVGTLGTQTGLRFIVFLNC